MFILVKTYELFVHDLHRTTDLETKIIHCDDFLWE